MRSIEHEFAKAGLPDERLNRRLCRIATSAAAQPGATFPKMAASDGELEAIYRFMSNPRVTPSVVLEPHVRATFERSGGCSTVAVAHDTTDFECDGEAAEELGYLNTGRHGFFGHFSLVLGEQHAPLGVGSMITFERRRRPAKRGHGKRQGGFYTAKKKHREMLRWRAGIENVERGLPQGTSAVHVMDRGADSYELFSELVAQDRRFVVRLRQMHDRVAAADDEATTWATLGEVADAAKYVCEREVPLSRRRAKKVPKVRYAPRKQRWATLHLEASPLILRRPRHRPAKSLPSELSLSLVRVREVDAPAGEEPVDWWLVTTESADTAADVEAVVDWYRARWKIEEFFKALKTGCGWRERHLETRAALLNTLALLTPIAWHVLAIRDLSRVDGTAPATRVFSTRQLHILRAMSKRPVPPDATVEQAMLAVAGQGGHLMRNGAPGWQTLGRGLEKLWWANYGYGLALAGAATCDG